MRSINSERVAHGEISRGSADLRQDLPDQEADGRTDRRHRQSIGVTCDECLHKPICMEQRGPCREFKTIEMVRKEIEQLNENHKKVATRSKADQRPQRPQL